MVNPVAVSRHDETMQKNVLVCFWDLVKGTDTMKRIYTLIVLMGLVMGALVTGCNKEETAPPASTNAFNERSLCRASDMPFYKGFRSR